MDTNNINQSGSSFDHGSVGVNQGIIKNEFNQESDKKDGKKTWWERYGIATIIDKLGGIDVYSDYNFSSEVKVISGKYPLELLVYNHQVKFDMAIGVYSTATSIKGLALKQINLLSNEDWINKSNFIKGNTLDDKWSKNVY